jgi:hypothetical protein
MKILPFILIAGLIATRGDVLAKPLSMTKYAEVDSVRLDATSLGSWTGETAKGGSDWLFYWQVYVTNKDTLTAIVTVTVTLQDRHGSDLARITSKSITISARHAGKREGYAWIPADIRWRTAHLEYKVMPDYGLMISGKISTTDQLELIQEH